MKYYDCHTHLNYEPLSNNADNIAFNCKDKNIILNNVGTNLKTSLEAITLSKKHDNVFAIVGIHPNDVKIDKIENVIEQMHEWLKNKNINKIVAIGETGLDYHHPNYDKQTQHQYLLEHIKLAKQYHLPLMVHVRDAHEDMIKCLKLHKTESLTVIIHCYADNCEIVKQYIALGCYISIPGIITFKNANALKQSIHCIPLNRLLSETDAPWLTPEPYRGKLNTPEYISFIIKTMANELQMDAEKLADIVFANSLTLFKV